MSEIKLGKISYCAFGFGGYQDACIGISFTFSGDGWGVGDFWGSWAIERGERAEWTEQDRINQLGKIVLRINGVLKEAKVENVASLIDIPVEVSFSGNTLSSWRILKEVL